MWVNLLSFNPANPSPLMLKMSEVSRFELALSCCLGWSLLVTTLLFWISRLLSCGLNSVLKSYSPSSLETSLFKKIFIRVLLRWVVWRDSLKSTFYNNASLSFAISRMGDCSLSRRYVDTPKCCGVTPWSSFCLRLICLSSVVFWILENTRTIWLTSALRMISERRWSTWCSIFSRDPTNNGS